MRMSGGRFRPCWALALAIGLAPTLTAADNPPPTVSATTPATSDPLAGRQAAIAAALAAGMSAPPAAPGTDAAPDLIPPLPPAPHTFETAPGQFEISSFDLAAAGSGLTVAEEVWQSLERPLDLPPHGFPMPITVRLLPSTQWTATMPFQAAAELGGRVSVRVRWSPDPVGTAALRHALVQALLMRVAIAWHGLGPALRVPFWLEQGCLAWSLTHTHPALLDEWQQDSARTAPPTLEQVLGLKREAPAPRPEELGTLWLLAHLQAESGPERRWPALLRAMLGGEDPLTAVGRIYGGYFNNDPSRELWWQVGWHAQRRLSASAVSSAADSRVWVAGRARWVARRGEADLLLSLDEVFAARQQPWIAAELQQRIGQLKGELGSNSLHPFYRNAAVSLGRAYEAARMGNPGVFAIAEADAERDYADGLELENAADAALDQLEETGSQTSEVRSQKSEVRGQKSDGEVTSPAASP